jgi:methionyl-tRNA formyltransferase
LGFVIIFGPAGAFMAAAGLRLVMMGTGTFAEPVFQALLDEGHTVVGLVTQPDRAVGEQRGSTRQVGLGMKPLAEQYGIPVYQPLSVNTPEGVAKLREWGADVLVVAAYGQILSNDVLAAARLGGINVHASLLPKYRGAAPVAWAIYHGETRTGVTIIRMSVYLDAGDILAQQALDISPEETAGELEARLAPLGACLALEVLDQLAAGTARGVKQDKSLVTRAPKLTKENGLIDWSRSGREVCNQIRAMQPWPTPYTFLHEQDRPPLRVIIPRAAWRDAASHALAPGHILVQPEAPGRLVVAAGAGSAVEILEIQPAGKRRMPAEDFLRGHRLGADDFFGPEQP